jgi:multidrug efflux pump subunit AcrB
MPQPQRGFVGRITDYFIRSQVTVLIIVTLVVFGISAALFTPKEKDPQIEAPAANVFLTYPGAPATVVEDTVTQPMEAKLREIPGVDNIYSVSRAGRARITVNFFVGEDFENSLFELQNKVFNWQDILPSGVDYTVKPIIVDDVPIVTLTVMGDGYTDNELRRVGEHLLQALRQVPDTGNLTITGGQPRTIQVDLDPARLASYRLSPPRIAQRLEEANQRFHAQDITVGRERLFIEGGNLFQTATDVGNTVVGRGQNNQPIYLRDVATVRDGYGDRTTLSRIHYREDWPATEPYPDLDLQPSGEFVEKPAMTIGIAKKEGTNAVTVAQAIFDKADQLKADLPPDVELAVSRNNGRSASMAVNSLYTSLAQSVGIVTVLLLLFLGWRDALIVALAIPLTLGGTLLVGWIAGQTINRITLFALILSLGILVDDGVAVTENIHRHLEERPNASFKDKIEAAVEAVDELGGAILLSTLTIILAIVPMAFVTGLMGPYMQPIPFNLPVAMIISTTLAVTVVPYLGVRLIKVKQNQGDDSDEGDHQEAAPETDEGPPQTRVYRFYRWLMQPLLDHKSRRRILIGLVFGLLLATATLPLVKAVRFRMLPKIDEERFLVQLDMPLGTELVRTEAVTRELEAALRQDPQLVQFESYVGTGAPIDFNGLFRGYNLREGEHLADIRAHLTDDSARSPSSEDIVFRLRPELTAIAHQNNARIALIEVPPGPPVRSVMRAEVYGPDYGRIREIARNVRRLFTDTEGVVDVNDSVKNQIPQMRLVVDRLQANQVNLTTGAIAQSIRMAVAGADVSTLQVPGELTPVAINVRFAEANRRSIADLAVIQLPTSDGRLVPLSELVTFEAAPFDQPIFHKDQRPVAYVSGEMGDRSPVYATLDQIFYFWNNPLPDGYAVEWEGEWSLTLEVFRDLGLAMLVAILLIYLLLVAWFRSFKTPVIILGAIPLALIGILIGFSLNGVYFSATAMIGVIALAGIVVRNAIVLLEFVRQKLDEGEKLKPAIIEAGAVRFRPIMLTSITTMLGTMTILTDPVWSGLAWTLLTGMLTSSALTLIIIPLIYYGDLRKQRRHSKSTTQITGQIPGKSK